MNTFIQCGDFYPVRKLLPSVEYFIQCGDFYSVCKLLSSVETFIQHEDFYLLQRLMPSMETFIQCVDLYPIWRLLSSADTFIQCSNVDYCKRILKMLLHICIFFPAYVSFIFKNIPVRLIKYRTLILKKYNIYSPVPVNFSRISYVCSNK